MAIITDSFDIKDVENSETDFCIPWVICVIIVDFCRKVTPQKKKHSSSMYLLEVFSA